MNLSSKLSKIILEKKTLLGVGPMSINVINSSIELSNFFDIYLILIASRRQIDIREFGGGYVEGWSTSDFSNYISKKDKKNKIILARDHGGPWQNNFEIQKKMNLKDAMSSAKESYKADILNNFKIIHIDPSIDIFHKLNINKTLELIYELYEFCYSFAKKNNKEILFELGTEEQNHGLNTIEELDYWINKIKIFCKKNKFPNPFFIVAQTGTKVMELKNIGSFDSDVRQKKQLPAEIQIPKITEWAVKNGLFIKEHNADYLSNDSLKWHPKLGIHAANVAPEFATVETKALLKLFDKCNMKKEKNIFIDEAIKSKKWKKWMMKDDIYKDDEYKAIICGHYIYNIDIIKEIKHKLEKKLNSKNINLNENLKKHIKVSIMRYLSNFKLIN